MKSSICKTFFSGKLCLFDKAPKNLTARNERLFVLFEHQVMKIDRMDDLKNVESAASVSSGGSNNGVGRGANNTTSTDLNYSIPGILHFLQHEWSRFEMERGQWEVERAELQVKITLKNP